MWEILDISIPAVVLVPLIAIGVVIWFCLQQNARSSDVRRAEFQRLRRLAMEEHERAERELEQEYMRQKPVDSAGVHAPGGEFPRRRPPGPPGNGYGNVDRGDVGLRGDAGLGGYGNYGNHGNHGNHDHGTVGDARRRKQAEDDEHRRKQGEAALRRRQADEEERRAKERREEEELIRRKQAAAAAAEELRRETEERQRREAEEEMRRRQSDELDWQRRRADLEAQARREAEEERRRQAAAEEEEREKRWKQEEAQSREAQMNFSPRKVHPSNLTCVVCEKPTKQRRRCSRCKNLNYCSRECQVQHWNDGHKYDCRPVDIGASPRSSVDGDTRNYSDFNSPRSNK